MALGRHSVAVMARRPRPIESKPLFLTQGRSTGISVDKVVVPGFHGHLRVNFGISGIIWFLSRGRDRGWGFTRTASKWRPTHCNRPERLVFPVFASILSVFFR